MLETPLKCVHPRPTIPLAEINSEEITADVCKGTASEIVSFHFARDGKQVEACTFNDR